ncbi:hypothetical protein [Saccharopolyspora sp. NPDC002578]
MLSTRLDRRGRHSRFERQADSSSIEAARYAEAAAQLGERGWPLLEVSCAENAPEAVAWTVALHVLPIYEERSGKCPA